MRLLGGWVAYEYFSAPAEAEACPFFDGSVRFLVEFGENGGDLRGGFVNVGVVGEVGTEGFLFFGRVKGEPARVGVMALEYVWDKDLILVGAVAALGKEIGALVSELLVSSIVRYGPSVGGALSHL